jgi:hypothetical protein
MLKACQCSSDCSIIRGVKCRRQISENLSILHALYDMPEDKPPIPTLAHHQLKKHHDFMSLQTLEAVGIVGTFKLDVSLRHTKPLPSNVSDLIYLFGTFFKTSLHTVQQIFFLHLHVLELHQILHIFIVNI